MPTATLEKGSELASPRLPTSETKSKRLSIWDEAGNAIFLIILYCLQGVPLGLSMGSMPFLLQAHSSFTDIGIFGMAAYPYSCKLLWSPLVDSIFHRKFGRRKSWIVPIQTLSSIVLFFFAETAEEALLSSNILKLSILFFVLVLLAATQDIAVDGWALTLLSRQNLGYTSTCQTIGMNVGFFLSFSVFLAFNDAEFCNRYFRTEPKEMGLITLSGYMKFWGVIYALLTLYIAIWKQEKQKGEPKQSIKKSYSELWNVFRLPAVRRLATVFLFCRIGSVVAEAAGTLKLLEKGVSKEAISSIVLLEFPIELFSAVIAGRWISEDDALSPFIHAYQGRLLIAFLTTYMVSVFPVGVVHWFDNPLAFLMILLVGVVGSFVSTLMYTAQGAFFSQISDPVMGGAYLTLLNAIANMGSSLPRLVVMWLMDRLTVRSCELNGIWSLEWTCPSRKDQALSSNPCTNAGGVCLITTDGFFRLSYVLIFVGAVLGPIFSGTLRKLQKLPLEAWRVLQHKES